MGDLGDLATTTNEQARSSADLDEGEATDEVPLVSQLVSNADVVWTKPSEAGGEVWRESGEG